MTFRLDRATALEKVSDEEFVLPSNEAYWNFKSAFGGWLCAGAAKALVSRSDFRGEVFSLNVSFISAVSAPRIIMTVNLLKRKRTMDFWRLQARDADGDDSVLFAADMVSGIRRDGDLTFDDKIPEHAALDQSIPIEPNPLAPKWIALMDQRIAKGQAFAVNEDAQSVLWIKEADDRPFDALAALAFLDAPMPRTYFLQERISMASSLSMSSHIYASSEEMSEVGTDHLLLAVTSAGVNHSLYNQEARLFRQDGRLIATSYQTAIYR